MNIPQTTQQSLIETNVRMMLGDLQLQVIVANARITELEQKLAAAVPEAPAKANGKDHKAAENRAPPA